MVNIKSDFELCYKKKHRNCEMPEYKLGGYKLLDHQIAWEMWQEARKPDENKKVWCEYIANMIGSYLNEPVDSDKCKAIAGIIERRLWAFPEGNGK